MHVFFRCRNEKQANGTVNEIKAATGNARVYYRRRIRGKVVGDVSTNSTTGYISPTAANTILEGCYGT